MHIVLLQPPITVRCKKPFRMAPGLHPAEASPQLSPRSQRRPRVMVPPAPPTSDLPQLSDDNAAATAAADGNSGGPTGSHQLPIWEPAGEALSPQSHPRSTQSHTEAAATLAPRPEHHTTSGGGRRDEFPQLPLEHPQLLQARTEGQPLQREAGNAEVGGGGGGTSAHPTSSFSPTPPLAALVTSTPQVTSTPACSSTLLHYHSRGVLALISDAKAASIIS